MADFIFDGTAKIMTEPAGAGDTTADALRDLYSAWKRWVQSGAGTRFPQAFLIEGGTPIGSTGLFSGYTLLMTNGWKVKAASHNHQLLIIGNLYSDDGIVSVVTAGFSTNIFVSSAVAAQGVSTGGGGGGLTTQQDQRLKDARDFALQAALQTQPV